MNSSKIVFTGITGLLGQYFLKKKDPSYEIIGIADKNIPKNSKFSFRVNITDRNAVLDFIKKTMPKIIVHAASIGNVDYCEKHPDEAYEVNVKGTRNVVEAAKEINAKIIFLSSNAIYDGTNSPYDEKSNPNPIDIYGKTKVEGEDLIVKSGIPYVIVRLMTMYGWPPKGGRSNPVAWIIRELREKQRINVVNDVYNNHLWAGQAAEAVWRIIKKNVYSDIYNIAGRDCISRFELALKVAKAFNLNVSLISAVNSDFFKDLAKRPKNTCFNTSKMEKELSIRPLTVEEGLQLMRDNEGGKND